MLGRYFLPIDPVVGPLNAHVYMYARVMIRNGRISSFRVGVHKSAGVGYHPVVMGDWLVLKSTNQIHCLHHGHRLLGIERPPGFCSVHFMLCPQGIALQKSSVSGRVEKIGVVAVATCAQSGIVLLWLLWRPMHARDETKLLGFRPLASEISLLMCASDLGRGMLLLP